MFQDQYTRDLYPTQPQLSRASVELDFKDELHFQLVLVERLPKPPGLRTPPKSVAILARQARLHPNCKILPQRLFRYPNPTPAVDGSELITHDYWSPYFSPSAFATVTTDYDDRHYEGVYFGNHGPISGGSMTGEAHFQCYPDNQAKALLGSPLLLNECSWWTVETCRASSRGLGWVKKVPFLALALQASSEADLQVFLEPLLLIFYQINISYNSLFDGRRWVIIPRRRNSPARSLGAVELSLSQFICGSRAEVEVLAQDPQAIVAAIKEATFPTNDPFRDAIETAIERFRNYRDHAYSLTPQDPLSLEGTVQQALETGGKQQLP